MRTTKEIAAMRDKLAAEMPQADKYQFPTLNDLFAFVGMEPSASFAEQVAASVKAQAKIRYMYADAMMEARESSKEVAEEPVADDDGWIEHDGKDIPVSPYCAVEIMMRDGTQFDDKIAEYWHSDKSEKSNWIHVGDSNDIVRYRVVP